MSIITGVPDQTAVGWLTIPHTTNNQRAWWFGAFTVGEPLFLHTLGARLRRFGAGNGNVQFAVWADTGLGQPGVRLAYTGNVVASALSTSTGAAVAAPILAGIADGPTTPATALRLLPGLKYFFGIQVETNGVSIGTIAPEATCFQRTAAGNPSAPFGGFTTLTPVSPSTPILWGIAEQDVLAVTTLSAPPALIATLSPVISGTISQADSAPPANDRLAQYQIEVREAATTAQRWFATFSATSAERSSGSFSQVYAGTTLVPGTAYEVHARAAGDLGQFGPYSAWRPFAVGALGAVDVTFATPTGKQATGVVGPYTARWTHPSALAMTAVQVQLLVNGVPARISPVISKAADANAVFSISTAEAAISTASDPLPPGAYTYQFRGTDSIGSVSPWSTAVPFTVNAPPNQPSNLRPTSGSTLADRPRLLWDGSDPDLEDVFGGSVSSQVELTPPGSSATLYNVSSVDPGSGSGYLDLTSSHLPNPTGTTTWRVRLSDGLVFGPWSAPAIFTLQVAPLVTIDEPDANETVTSSTPGIVFSMVDDVIAAYRARLYRANVVTPFFDSGPIAVDPPATSQTYQPAPGWLENGQLYDVDIVATPAVLGGSSTSAKTRFRVSYPTEAGLSAVDATLLSNERDWEPTSVVLVWGMSSLPQNEFGGYVIWRRGGNETAEQAVPIRRIPSAGQTTFVDHHPPPNQSLIYSVSQLRLVAGDTRSGDPVDVQIDTTLTVPVLASLTSGATLRAPLVWLSTGLSRGFRRADSTVETWASQGAPLWVRNPVNYGAESFAVKFTLRSDRAGTLHQHLAAWKAIVTSGDPFSLRTETDRVFVRIVPGASWASRGSSPGTYDISLTLEQIYYREAADLTA